MRISVFDSQSVVHKGLSSLLPGQGHSIVSQAPDGRDAVSIVRGAFAELVLTEIHMPHVNGIGVLEQIDAAGLKIPVLVYSSDDNPTFVARAVVHGAHDYVLKSATVAKLLYAINNAGRSGDHEKTPLFVTIRDQLQKRDGLHHGTLDLTSREMQVLRHLGLGLSNRDIAKFL
ncbi:MAG: response regulator transcription factor, partial [Pirellulaceae bacterium]|nr:response regulator transcription factor [Pirellulaceae bacterium]